MCIPTSIVLTRITIECVHFRIRSAIISNIYNCEVGVEIVFTSPTLSVMFDSKPHPKLFS